MSKLKEVKDLGKKVEELERVDDEIEQLQRVLSRHMLKKNQIETDLDTMEQISGIDLKRKK
ncbi:MAG: hypothetical protein ACYS8I_13830 [Planctomycetota bacterium]|jgi:hypothetical protein